MKNLFIGIILCLPLFCSGQQIIRDTILVDGLYRSYILYKPASYHQGTNAPLILNFHGYTSNALDQMNYGSFRAIADTAGFLVVQPQGTLDNLGITHWNVGWGTSTVDDVHFVSALIDSLSTKYSINQKRIYSTGMSNGGFFSYKLACELSDRIAAIASVTGTFNVGQTLTCHPQRPIPVMEIHGTSDPTVPYNGTSTFASIPSVLQYWTTFNACDPTPVITDVPNTNLVDNCTAQHQVWSGGTNGVEVEHFKIVGGNHSWPGAPIGGSGTNRDINASKEIWRFFSKYDINGAINQGINCNSFCITNIQLDSLNPGNWLVSILFSSTDSNAFINYPFVSAIITLQGDTIATGTLDFFGQFSNTSQDYHVTGLLPSIPEGLEARVDFNFDTVSCSLLFPCATTSIEESFLKPEISIFPNPWSDETNILLDKPYNNIEVELFNSLGQIENPALEKSDEKIILHRNGLPTGLYFLVLHNDQFLVTKKLIIVN